MVTVRQKQDLIGEFDVASNLGIEPALAAVYVVTPTIVDVLSAEDEDEHFQCFPITDISVRLVDGEKHYVTSSPAGPVTMSATRAYKRLELAKQFDKKVKSNYLPDIKNAEKIATEHFPDYAKVATTRYKQRVNQCLDGKIDRSEENELMAYFSDSGITTLIDGENTDYMQRTENDFQDMNRNQAFETLRAFANYQHLMNGDIREMEFAKHLAQNHLPHLVEQTDEALNSRYSSIRDDEWFDRAGGLNPAVQYGEPIRK